LRIRGKSTRILHQLRADFRMIEQDFCTIGHSHYAGGSAKVKLTKNQKPREDNMGNAKTETLKSSLRGNLIQNDDVGYAEACKLYNGMIDKRPLMIARCTDVADVIAVVTFARDNGHLLAIRGGGHNGPGLGSCDGGVVIDLSPMKGVRIDPETCLVRVDPAAPRAIWTMRPMRSGWRYRRASSRRPASEG
jgi:hypothetical protein